MAIAHSVSKAFRSSFQLLSSSGPARLSLHHSRVQGARDLNSNHVWLITTRAYRSAPAAKVREQENNPLDHDVPEGVLLGIGNPLLDITVKADEAFLKKYGLKANNAIIAGPRHIKMFEDIMHMNPIFIPGGAAQNTIRVAQWLLQKPKSTSFLGCVGVDDRAEILKQAAEDVGVNISYQPEYREQTGVCAAVITGRERSLITDPGAATCFSHHWLEGEEQQNLVEQAQVFYICGFLFPVCLKTIQNIGLHAAEHNKQLVMNLSAQSLAHYFSNPKINIMPYIDVLVGNTYEMMHLNEGLGTGLTNIEDIAHFVSRLPKKTSRPRTVIVTRGRQATVIAHDGDVESYDVSELDNSSIVDTNGCGDAYMGGYLAQLVQGKSIDDCVECAKYSAKTVIQHHGCTFPEKPDITFT